MHPIPQVVVIMQNVMARVLVLAHMVEQRQTIVICANPTQRTDVPTGRNVIARERDVAVQPENIGTDQVVLIVAIVNIVLGGQQVVQTALTLKKPIQTEQPVLIVLLVKRADAPMDPMDRGAVVLVHRAHEVDVPVMRGKSVTAPAVLVMPTAQQTKSVVVRRIAPMVLVPV